MAFFKRIEVWVLLALTVAGVVAVLRMDDTGGRGTRGGSGDRNGSGNSPAAGGDRGVERSQDKHRVDGVSIERDGDHAVVEIVVWLGEESSAGSPFADTENARLLRADGSEVPVFFVPFQAAGQAVETIALAKPGAAAGKHVRLMFWADEASLAGQLNLELGDAVRLAIKQADGFQLKTLDDGGRKVLSTAGQERGAAS